MTQDEYKELTRKSTRGTFVLHFVGLLGFRGRTTWCICGSVMRLGDFREAS